MAEIDGSTELEAVETVAVPETTDAPPEAPAAPAEEVKQEVRTYTEDELQRSIQKEKARLERKFERERSARLEAEVAQLRQQQQPKVPDAQGKPKREDFPDDVSFVDALADFRATERIKEFETKRVRESAEQAEKRVFTDALSKHERLVEQMRKEVPDYDEIVGNEDLNISQPVAQAILMSDAGPKLALYLGKNPAEADRLSNLSPYLAAMELGKLEAKLSAPTAKTISNAPAPLNPVASGKALVADLAKMSQEEYEKYRAKQGARWAR